VIEDMAARRLNPRTQRSHIHSCRRFAAWVKRSPESGPTRPRSSASQCGSSARTVRKRRPNFYIQLQAAA
jgi:hypothetical protein